MARAAKARIFRSTRTAPNVSPAADLATAFGTAANTSTVAAFTASTSGFRWNPGAAGTIADIPVAPSTATGNGWRDTVAENAAEQVRYAAGTWTIRVRLNKTVMTVNATITVRVTVIVYRVTSAGAHVAELGRVVFADTDLPTVNAAVTVTGSFTGTQTTFNAGDKIQAEAYVQNIVAGVPSGAVASYTVAFVVDETSATAASFTAQPTYDILYARAQAVTAVGVAAMARRITAFRPFAVTTIGTHSVAKEVRPLPKAVVAIGTAANPRKAIATIPKSVTAVGTVSSAKSVGMRRAVTAVGSAVMVRKVTAAKAFATTAIGVANFGRALVFGRRAAATANGVASGRVDMPITALNRIIPAPAGDWPLNPPTKVIAGVTRNSAGAVVGGAMVKLIRQSDDVRVASTISHSTTGAYSFTRGGDDPNSYRVVAIKAGVPEIHGVSDELVPA